ncbi:MAG: response regulator [Thermodesulfobacteriota bacterium]|nr:response regulator [Thermodesulfobacteriota bacterium]
MGERNIMVCDDNTLNRKLVNAVLKDTCYSVIESHCGHDCLDYIFNQRGSVDLLLLDISMHDICGFEICKRLRQSDDKRCRDLPIIAYTAHAMEEERQSYFSAGFDDVLLKPVDTLSLVETINRHLVAL